MTILTLRSRAAHSFEASTQYWIAASDDLNSPIPIGSIDQRSPPVPAQILLTREKENKKIYLNSPFRPHEIVQHHHQPWRLFASQKWGNEAAFFDLREPTAPARIILPGAGARFFGHAQFTPNGEWLLTTEMNDHLKQGEIVVRRADSGRIETRIYSGGLDPHQLRIDRLDQSKVIVVNSGRSKGALETLGWGTSFGARPSMIWIDLQSGKIEKGFGFSDTHLTPSHFAQSESGALLIGGGTRRGSASHGMLGLLDHKGLYQSISIPGPLLLEGENLSLEMHPDQQRAFVVNSETNLLMEVDLKEQRVTWSQPLSPTARGVAIGPDGKIHVTFGKEHMLMTMNSHRENHRFFNDRGGSGPHLYVFKEF